MADAKTVSFLLFFLFGFTLAAQTSLPAKSGQSITLPCQVPDNRPVHVIEWSRADSTSEYVLLYRDEQLDPEQQLASYMNRADLVVRPVNGGNVSLVLQNVRNGDGGTYECRVYPEPTRKLLQTEPICIIKLGVVASDGSCQRHSGLIGVAVFTAVVSVVVGRL